MPVYDKEKKYKIGKTIEVGGFHEGYETHKVEVIDPVTGEKFISPIWRERNLQKDLKIEVPRQEHDEFIGKHYEWIPSVDKRKKWFMGWGP